MGASRFVIFCGNLPYTCDVERLKKFFRPVVADASHVTPRLLTTKDSGAFRGCAFVEFTDGNEFKKALKLHHSTMDGRKVRIELTSGGGGKCESRQQKIKGKQKKLQKERRDDFKKVKSADVMTKKKGKKKRLLKTELSVDARVPGIVERFKLNDDGSEYLKRQPPWLIDQIEQDFRLPEAEVRDVTGLLIKFSQGAKKKAYERWSGDRAGNNNENVTASSGDKGATHDVNEPSAAKKGEAKATSLAAASLGGSNQSLREITQSATKDCGGSAVPSWDTSALTKKRRKLKVASPAVTTEDGARTICHSADSESAPTRKKKKRIKVQSTPEMSRVSGISGGVTRPVEGNSAPMRKKKRAREETTGASST